MTFFVHFRIVLLNKLLEDGNVLYRKNRLQDASHRYQYALKKIPSNLENVDAENPDEDYAHNATYQQLKFNFLVNLSRCKRKMNVSRSNANCNENILNKMSLKEISESIDLASSAITIKPNNYDGYYARAKALMEANNLTEAFADTQLALEKVKLQQKYQKISTEVKETLNRLCEELNKRVGADHVIHRQHAETTDL